MEAHHQFIAMRKSLGYNQLKLATLFGVSKNTVCNWEVGRTDLPARVWLTIQSEYLKLKEKA